MFAASFNVVVTIFFLLDLVASAQLLELAKFCDTAPLSWSFPSFVHVGGFNTVQHSNGFPRGGRGGRGYYRRGDGGFNRRGGPPGERGNRRGGRGGYGGPPRGGRGGFGQQQVRKFVHHFKGSVRVRVSSLSNFEFGFRVGVTSSSSFEFELTTFGQW